MEVQYSEFNTIVSTLGLSTKYVETSNKYLLFAQEASFIVTATIYKSSAEATDFETNYKATFNQELKSKIEEPPFAAKRVDGRNLFNRTTGQAYSLAAGTQDCEFVVPFAEMKFNGLEVIGGEIGDSVNLFVFDDASGTYSGTPNYQLNQFGYTVFPAKDFYKKVSRYDADVFVNMKIVAEYTSITAKTVYINWDIHEIKD